MLYKRLLFSILIIVSTVNIFADNVISQSKKEKYIYPKGKKIFDAKCKKNIDFTKFTEMDELKSAIKSEHICKPLKEKYLQSVTLYLWEVKRVNKADTKDDKVIITPDEKCPVCGMFTYKYPRWATQIFYTIDKHHTHYSFDGVKDLMKFYFQPRKWGKYSDAKRKNITKILVTDYYTQKGIDGREAFYVIGSDVYGPMGNELIPFKNKDDAKTFKKDHYAKSIINFKDITEEDVYKLDYDER